MSVDIVQLYGPGLSFYLSRAKVSGTREMTGNQSSSSLDRYSNALRSLNNSNVLLENRLDQLRENTMRLELDVMRLQRHIKTSHGELLVTWQADTLTRLVEVVYERHGWKLPGGITSTSTGDMEQAEVSLMYRTAARKIKKETLWERFGLSLRYHVALEKYDEVSLVGLIGFCKSESFLSLTKG
ncbi:hypothetical protein BDV25DRAFT_141859 [Aspergillus avenaceus]|uniref:Uncharacterized protein n=1 Tax=Aspergillus avenaceus TaxID=36643 RepID=A0A5N6TPV4_ASPAV|nr:hypothetical protein BDV25DRAFT_141859 [Aspergillus avenaceus]